MDDCNSNFTNQQMSVASCFWNSTFGKIHAHPQPIGSVFMGVAWTMGHGCCSSISTLFTQTFTNNLLWSLQKYNQLKRVALYNTFINDSSGKKRNYTNQHNFDFNIIHSWHWLDLGVYIITSTILNITNYEMFITTNKMLHSFEYWSPTIWAT